METPQARSEVGAVDAHVPPPKKSGSTSHQECLGCRDLLVHEEDVERVQIKGCTLAGGSLAIPDPVANHVGCRVREEAIDMVVVISARMCIYMHIYEYTLYVILG